jgi:hypothetical protein
MFPYQALYGIYTYCLVLSSRTYIVRMQAAVKFSWTEGTCVWLAQSGSGYRPQSAVMPL